MLVFYIVVSFIYGTIFSSFITLVGYRVPLKISIVKPNSHCFTCKKKLGLLDLIPVLSYIFSGGKCRNCGIKYGSLHVWMELAVGILFAVGTYLYIDNYFKMLLVMVIVLCVNALYVSLTEHGFLLKGFLYTFLIAVSLFIYLSDLLILSVIFFVVNNVLFYLYNKEDSNKIKNLIIIDFILFMLVLLLKLSLQF